MSSDPRQNDFEAESNAFWTWIQQQPGTAVSPKIRVADLRAEGQGRGVSKTLSFSPPHYPYIRASAYTVSSRCS